MQLHTGGGPSVQWRTSPAGQNGTGVGAMPLTSGWAVAAALPTVAPGLVAMPPSLFTGPPLSMHVSFVRLGGVPQSHATSVATHPHALQMSRVVYPPPPPLLASAASVDATGRSGSR